MRKLYDSQDYCRALPEDEEESVGRSPFRRDFGRLLHSPSFRRLQGKTQLFPGHETDFFRNRLTHSLEVAQVAKGIAQLLNKQSPIFAKDPLDLDLVEFAGLAHDLGHPPFGHNGEKALDDCMREYGGFEGNAQTLRILSRVEKKVYLPVDDEDSCAISSSGVDRRLGLNLTYRSLAAILKYDHKISQKRGAADPFEKGYYDSEAQLVEVIKDHIGVSLGGRQSKSIECQIMDIADDIAYSTYDLEDAMKGGFSHPIQLLARIAEDEKLFKEIFKKVADKVDGLEEDEVYMALGQRLASHLDIEEQGPLELYSQSKLIASDARQRSQFTSQMIGAFMAGVSVEESLEGNSRFATLTVDRSILIQIEAIKHLNYLITIMSPRLKVVEYRGYEVVREIFKTLSDGDGGMHLLPDDIQKMYERTLKEADRKRLICDFVSGMTDRYALEFYSRLKESGQTIFKPI